jgi:hypothetical protein
MCVGVAAVVAGCFGDISDPAPADPDNRITTPTGTVPAPPAMRRLTGPQYAATLRSLFGTDITVPVELEADTPVNGFVAIGAARTTVSPRAAELYEQSALAITEAVFADATRRDAVVSCTPASMVDSECARTFVSEFGRRAWRRPLEADEVARYAAIADQSAIVLEDFYAGLSMAAAGLLQSPNFLFRVEVGEAAPEGGRRYTSIEMASRLSYTLWNAPPDEDLLALGESGALVDPDRVREQALRMIDSPETIVAVRDFFGELLRLEGLDRLPQDPTIFTQMSSTIGPAMRDSTLLTLEDHFFTRGSSYRELLTSRRVFVNAELANLYGVTPPESGFEAVELPTGDARAGLLGQGAILALFSHGHASSPTLRGKFVRETLLCQSIPAPPDDVGELPEPDPTLPTMRDRLAIHRENPSCATCHNLTDPIGLALENFDAIGAYRETENDVRIDPSGELDGVPFADARGLGEALANHPQLSNCLVRNVYRFSTGHVESRGEQPTIDLLAESFDESSDLKALLVDLVTSDGFRYAGRLD